MKNKIILRALIGMPIGLAISTFIAIAMSLARGDGSYSAVVPQTTIDFGSEINAVLMQAVFSMLYGAAFAGASVVWETDWSLTRMTLVHLVICSAATFPTAYLMRWMPHSFAGGAVYFGMFFGIYAAIWCVLYFTIKRRIRSFNKKLVERETDAR